LWLLSAALKFFDHSSLRLFVNHDLVVSLAVFGNKSGWSIRIHFGSDDSLCVISGHRAHYSLVDGTLRARFAATSTSTLDALAERRAPIRAVTSLILQRIPIIAGFDPSSVVLLKLSRCSGSRRVLKPTSRIIETISYRLVRLSVRFGASKRGLWHILVLILLLLLVHWIVALATWKLY
jgi:hypothetical protein